MWQNKAFEILIGHLFNKKIFLFLISTVVCCQSFCTPKCFSGNISPHLLAQPVPKYSRSIDDTADILIFSKNLYVRPAGLKSENVEARKIILQDYTDLLKDVSAKDPTVPSSILGAVKIVSDARDIQLWVCIPLISYIEPQTELEVLSPNLTGSAWAETGLIAHAGDDGFSALFAIHHPGSYAVYNPKRKQYLPQKAAAEPGDGAKTDDNWRVSNGRQRTESAALQFSEDWGLHIENSPSSNKIPLILVHGDNSYKEKKDRWDDFLDWADENAAFDNNYEIWRFHHDTRKLIGFDGKSGNSAELGDAISGQFGPDTPIVLLAHSRGGLVSRSYMCKYGDGNQGDRVLGLVTLATPHHGSPGAVPDWGLETIEGKFRDTDLASVLYGVTGDAVVNVADTGTMGLAWDNFDGPDNGVRYKAFRMESDLGDQHVLSELDTNLNNPMATATEVDITIYLPDRKYGTLEALNADDRYFHKIIAYGGYDTDLGLGGSDPFNWLNFSFSDHTGLEMATHVMADIASKTPNGDGTILNFIANDGMVPLQSAFFLKKDTANEPMYTVKKEDDWYTPESYEVKLKNFTNRMQFRKAVICPDYDHLHMIEARGGLLHDKSDYWRHVAASINELADLGPDASTNFTPSVEEIEDSLPSISSVASGDNCFIRSASHH